MVNSSALKCVVFRTCTKYHELEMHGKQKKNKCAQDLSHTTMHFANLNCILIDTHRQNFRVSSILKHIATIKISQSTYTIKLYIEGNLSLTSFSTRIKR